MWSDGNNMGSKIITEFPKYEIFSAVTDTCDLLKIKLPEEIIMYLLDLFSGGIKELPNTLVEIMAQATSEVGIKSLVLFKKLGDSGLVMASLYHERQKTLGLSNDYYRDMSEMGYDRLSNYYPKSVFPIIVEHHKEVVAVCRTTFSL